MTSTIWGIVGSILGALAVFAAKAIVKYFQERSGPLTGNWTQLIPPQKGEPEKRDIVQCRDYGSKIIGEIKRSAPPDQSTKCWKFQGIRHGSLVFLTFWTTDRGNNPDSYGSIQLNRIGDNHYKGFYVKLIVTSGEQRFTGQFETFSLDWEFLVKKYNCD